MKRITINMFLAILLCIPCIQANNTDFLKLMTPNSYAFTQYGSIPVSLALGIPQIHIPLMTLTDKGINLDVSLSYHASGIKVDQEASWVGLGWTLNYGGVITRSVKGEPDDYRSNGYLLDRTSLTDYDWTGDIDTYLNNIDYNLHLGATGQTDNEPDIFYYNFCGKAGKFFLDGTGKACMESYEDLKIEYLYENSKSYFKIIDDSGNTYEFRNTEETSYGSPRENHVISWYLSKITNLQGANITFRYKEGGRIADIYQKRRYSAHFQGINQGINDSYPIGIRMRTTSETEGKDWWDERSFERTGIVVERITTSSGASVDFTTSGNRKDAEAGLANNLLTEITLKTPSNSIAKKYAFTYSYFEADDTHKEPSKHSFLNHFNYRLRLDAIKEVSTTERLNPYQFEYYGDAHPVASDVYKLPYRLSPCQDHWGYFNASANSIMFPGTSQAYVPFERLYRDLSTSDPMAYTALRRLITEGANREPHAEAVKAGSLRKIIYPTGGYTTFDFESHPQNEWGGFPNFGGIRIKRIETSDDNGHISVKEYSYVANSILNDECFNKDTQYHTAFFRKKDPVHPNELPDSRTQELLMLFGVPPYIASDPQYNMYLKINEYPRIMEGYGELRNTYRQITEEIVGGGKIVYEYLSPQSLFGWGGYNEQTIGQGHTAYVRTRSVGAENYVEKIKVMFISPCDAPFPEFTYTNWRQDLLSSKRIYAEDGTILSEKNIQYDEKELFTMPAYKLMKLHSDGFEYVYSRYYIMGGIAQVKEEKNIDYAGNQAVQSTTEYDYLSAYHKKVTEKRWFINPNDKITERYYYPTEYGSTFLNLKNNNFLQPIDVRSYRNGKLISGTQIAYNDAGQPIVKYIAEPTGSDIAFNASTPFTFTPCFWNTYNSKHLLATQKGRDNLEVIYIWSYKGEHPIARIQNATLSEVETAVQQTFGGISLETLENQTIPNESKLIDGSLQKKLPQALVTTYTYKPSVGISSITNAAEATTHYEYDDTGRLKCIKDNEGNVLESYIYSYKE